MSEIELQFTVRELQRRDEAWMSFAREVGRRLSCLHSSFPDGNDHILKALDDLLIKNGEHTKHCRKRQKWGDGECECGTRS